MNTNAKKPLQLAFLCLLTGAHSASGQGTTFTYQAQLSDTGNAASGRYDFTFALYNNNGTNTGQIGPTVTNLNVGVTNGYLMTTMDFGAVFTGTNLWLAIGARGDGATNFTVLSPLQPVTPTPYSEFATTASNLSGTLATGKLTGTIGSGNLSGTYGSALTFSNTANSYKGSYSGNGGNLTNVNAASLGGLAAASFWQTAGNTVSTGQFLGSTNNQLVDLRVNNLRALRLSPGTNDAPNLLGGAAANFVDTNLSGAVIAGGGTTNFQGAASSNHVSASFSTVAGGSGNWIQPGADHSLIAGGWNNTIASNANFSVIAGGANNTNSASYSVSGGGANNTSEASYSTVAGGLQNTASAPQSFVGGGQNNQAANTYATVAGGTGNTANGYGSSVGGGSGNMAINNNYPTVGGGLENTASGSSATVAGGDSNSADSFSSTVGGGYGNQANNSYATVPGGQGNVAGGQWSFAAGQQAQALHQGAFVWADSQNALFSSTGNDQFDVRAQGGMSFVTSLLNVTGAVEGTYASPFANIENQDTTSNSSPALRVKADGSPLYGALVVSTAGPVSATNTNCIVSLANSNLFVSWLDNNGNWFAKGKVNAQTLVTLSDRNAKENFQPVSPREVLDKVAALPVSRWNYKQDKNSEHLGPMAQDFYAAFSLGEDDRHIATVDEGGVALAAIQGLNQKLESSVKEKDAEIASLKERLATLETLVRTLANQSAAK